MDNDSDYDLDEAIIDQGDLSRVSGKLVVLAVSHEDEQQAFADLFAAMDLGVKYASTAAEVMQLLEDFPADLLLLDMQLPDIHAWKMISKIREVGNLRDLPVIVITDQASLGMTVAKVDYLTRPVSIARLRHNVWTALNQGHSDTDTTSS